MKNTTSHISLGQSQWQEGKMGGEWGVQRGITTRRKVTDKSMCWSGCGNTEISFKMKLSEAGDTMGWEYKHRLFDVIKQNATYGSWGLISHGGEKKMIKIYSGSLADSDQSK